MGLNFEQLELVKSISRGILEQITYMINNDSISEISEIESEIESTDDTDALNLDLHDQVDLVVNYGEDYDLSDVRCSSSKLRYEIENYANIILHHLATELALEEFKEFKEFAINEYGSLKRTWRIFQSGFSE